MNEAAVELAHLLQTWRARRQPEDIGSPFGVKSSRTPGLRREEVAWLAGVSPDYVKRLEQGRAHPSSAVLRSLARALHLSEAEYELAARLAGHAAQVPGRVPHHIGPGLQRVLERLGDTPVAVYDAAWTLLQTNELWVALTGESAARPGRSTNRVWRSFHDELGRVRHRSESEHRRSLVADLREVAARYPADPFVVGLVSDLKHSSAEFAELWAAAEVHAYSTDRKIVDHPSVGEIELDCDILSVHGSDLKIVVFTAAPGSAAATKLKLVSVIGIEDMNTVR